MKTDQAPMLRGIVEMDETYIGGKPRKGDPKARGDKSKRGRDTDKLPVAGAVERKGKIVAKSARAQSLSRQYFAEFIASSINTDKSVLMTDEYRGYNGMHRLLSHLRVNHSRAYTNGYINTNTIESFWAMLKRGHYDQFHHFSDKYADNYIAQFAYKWNNGREDVSLVFSNLTQTMLCQRSSQ